MRNGSISYSPRPSCWPSRSFAVARPAGRRQDQEQAPPARHAQRRLHPRLGRDGRRGAQGDRPEERVRRDLLAIHRDPDKKVKGKDGKETDRAGGVLARRFRGATKLPVEKENCGRINKETLKNFDVVLFFTTGNPVDEGRTRRPARVGEGRRGARGHALRDRHALRRIGLRRPDRRVLQGPPAGTAEDQGEDRRPEAPGRGRLHRRHGLPGRDVHLPRRALQPREAAHHLQHRPGVRSTRSNLARKDKDYAISWCRTEGKGKVFYTSFGHDPKVWKDEKFQKHLFGGLKWATGELPGEAKPSGSVVDQ